MLAPSSASHSSQATLVVISPSGTRTRIHVHPLPFTLGRSADNNLVLRDNRASRNHARILYEQGDFFIEDLKSSHGIEVNGARVTRQKLRDGDRIQFGVPDSYTLIFSIKAEEIHKILGQFPASPAAAGGDLQKLRALVEVARTVQNSLSPEDVLGTVVDGALQVTGFERGFLLLAEGGVLSPKLARDRTGATLPLEAFRVPVSALERALQDRRELLAMSFDARSAGFTQDTDDTASGIHRVICVPLVRVRTGGTAETQMITSKRDTVGLLYLDSVRAPVDLSSGNSELLQTLALEASTVLENARLLEEERKKQRMDEELAIARDIQSSLLPAALPQTGWFRAAGSSLPSHEVGGDYFDVHRIDGGAWAIVVADVSGKGVSSALLAALLQGAFLAASGVAPEMEQLIGRVNRYLYERTGGEKYATVFFAILHADGTLLWINAGHCHPILVRGTGERISLKSHGMPLGMLDSASYSVHETRLTPGDKVVAFSDGLSDAQNPSGDFFETRRIYELLARCTQFNSASLHAELMSAVAKFVEGAEQNDDVTAVIFEYSP